MTYYLNIFSNTLGNVQKKCPLFRGPSSQFTFNRSFFAFIYDQGRSYVERQFPWWICWDLKKFLSSRCFQAIYIKYLIGPRPHPLIEKCLTPSLILRIYACFCVIFDHVLDSHQVFFIAVTFILLIIAHGTDYLVI